MTQPEAIDLGQIPVNDRILPIIDQPQQYPAIPPPGLNAVLIGGIVTERFIDAAASGRLTHGGMAEAGWRNIGTIAGGDTDPPVRILEGVGGRDSAAVSPQFFRGASKNWWAGGCD